jgi:crotonobetainyl-CoA:carnitine CoA-transferase CaiB-like acyl-CoA transferase
VANDSLWHKFCELAGLADIANDPRFATNAARVTHRAQTVGAVQAVMLSRPRDEWLALLGEAGVPCAPINSFGDMLAHPHTAACGIVQTLEHPAYGRINTIAQPLTFDGERNRPQRPPPVLGEHTLEVLRQFGYSGEQIERFVASKAVAVAAAA